MPHEMNEFTKIDNSTLLKKHTDFVIKFTMSDSVCCLFAIDKGNSCLFETCVLLQLQTVEFKEVQNWPICDHCREGVQSIEIYFPRE